MWNGPCLNASSSSLSCSRQSWLLFPTKQAQAAAETWHSYKVQVEATDQQCPHCRSQSSRKSLMVHAWPSCAQNLLKHLEHEGLQWPISWETGHISPCREPGPHWTDPQGRTDTPASRKEGISLTFSLARQWVCLKKTCYHIFAPLCCLLQWFLSAWLSCRTLSLFPTSPKTSWGSPTSSSGHNGPW